MYFQIFVESGYGQTELELYSKSDIIEFANLMTIYDPTYRYSILENAFTPNYLVSGRLNNYEESINSCCIQGVWAIDYTSDSTGAYDAGYNDDWSFADNSGYQDNDGYSKGGLEQSELNYYLRSKNPHVDNLREQYLVDFGSRGILNHRFDGQFLDYDGSAFSGSAPPTQIKPFDVNDVEKYQAIKQQSQLRLDRINNELFDDLESLVLSPKYRSSTQDIEVPQYLSQLLHSLLELSISNLPTTYKSRVEDVVLVFSEDRYDPIKYINPKPLEARSISSEDTSSQIILSEALIRYVYLNSFSNSFNVLHPIVIESEDGLASWKYMSEEDIHQVGINTVGSFLLSFSFIINHELAHLYLVDKGYVMKDEYKADCYALKNMRSLGSEYYSLGSFAELMPKLFSEQQSGLWTTDLFISNIEDRISILSEIFNATIVNCSD